MKLKMILISLLLILFLVGCSEKEFQPKVKLSLDNNKIKMNDGISESFITATVTRNDDISENTEFEIKFPNNYTSIYPVNVDGERITELQTKTLKGKDSKDILQFKIFGEKGEAIQSTFKLDVELWWNNTQLEDSEEIEVIIE